MQPDTPRFNYGSLVYHRTSGEDAGVITGLLYRPSGMLYEVAWGHCSTDLHHECELTLEQPALRPRSDDWPIKVLLGN